MHSPLDKLTKRTAQMVLDAGRLVEFDSPAALLKQEDSLLRALVEESSDKEVLYAMAERKQSS